MKKKQVGLSEGEIAFLEGLSTAIKVVVAIMIPIILTCGYMLISLLF